MPETTPPAEVWFLRLDQEGNYIRDGFLTASREAEDDEEIVFLAMLSEADALKVAAYQLERYEVECYPVRVK